MNTQMVKMMEPKLNLWLEINGEVALSIWRADLLQAVADTGSISQAAQQMEVHYRTAWQKIHEMEERLGQKLIDTQTGGKGGGGAILTPTAQTYVAQFTQFSQRVEQFVQDQYQNTFADTFA